MGSFTVSSFFPKCVWHGCSMSLFQVMVTFLGWRQAALVLKAGPINRPVTCCSIAVARRISPMARGWFEGCQGCWKEVDHCWRTSSPGFLVVMIKVEFGGHYKLLLVIAMAVKSVSSFKKLQDQDFECPGPIFGFRFVNCALDRNSVTWKTAPTEMRLSHSGMIELLELLGGEAVMKRYMKSRKYRMCRCNADGDFNVINWLNLLLSLICIAFTLAMY